MGAAAAAEGDSEHKTDSVESKDAKQLSTIGVYIPSFFLNFIGVSSIQLMYRHLSPN